MHPNWTACLVLFIVYIGSGGDVAEALANICDVNTKLRRVELGNISPLPVMKSLAARQVPLEELDIFQPLVC